MAEKVALGSAASSGVIDWTPGLTFLTPGSSAFSAVNGLGKYVRNGNLIVANFRISPTATSVTGASGALLITGLPQQIEPVFAQTSGGFVSELDHLAWPIHVSQAVLQPCTSGPYAGLGILLQGIGDSDGGLIDFGASSVTVGTAFHLRGSFSYYTSS